jgi:hypothetical protein
MPTGQITGQITIVERTIDCIFIGTVTGNVTGGDGLKIQRLHADCRPVRLLAKLPVE